MGMDFGYAPGPDFAVRAMRTMLSLRDETQVVSDPNTRTVQDYIAYINTDPAPVTSPVHDLYLVSHGRESGWLAIDLYNLPAPKPGEPKLTEEDPKDTVYEVVEQARATDRIRLKDNVIGDPPRGRCFIIGCNIGKAGPFVDKFKEALGGRMEISASRHFYGISGTAAMGFWEFMAYEFRLHRPEKFADKAAAVQAYIQEGFAQIGGDPVPDELWEKWIPQNPHQSRVKTKFYALLSPETGGRKKINLNWEWRYDRQTFPITFPLDADPGNDDDRVEELRMACNSHQRFQGDFPVHKRLGYLSVDGFLAGYTWTYTWAPKEKELRCIGVRHEYTVVAPITHPAGFGTGNDVLTAYNFTPPKNSAEPPLKQLPDSDAFFYRTDS